MPTLTMQAIAELTGVKREVVSVWRTRSAGTSHPFPPSVAAGELLFEAEDVAAWLRATGRGNNSEAHLETLLHSSRFEELLDDLEVSSTLLVLHDQLGSPLAEVNAQEAMQAAQGLDLPALVALEDLPAHLARTDVVAAVDELAEAAYSARNLLDRIVGTFVHPRGPWAGEALTPDGSALVADVLRVLLEQAPRQVAPYGEGGLLLATTLSAALDDDAQPRFSIDEADHTSPVTRAALRMLSAHAGPDALSARSPEPHLALFQHQSATDAHTFFEQIDSLLLDLGPLDIAIVIGPAELLVEDAANEQTRAARSRLLVPAPDHPAPLRYAARLPKGLSRFGGRRRLAMWVLGTAQPHAGTDWTVYGEHADTALDASSRSAIAADISAALTGGSALTSHAFLRSTRLATSAFLRRPELVLTPFSRPQRSGGESMALLWELDDDTLAAALTVHSTGEDGTDPTVSWTELLGDLATEIRGTRLPPEAIGALVPGSAAVIGPEEVRDPSRIGTRAIDRLVLEQVTTRGVYTEPGDVVFTAEGGAAALIDTAGGHVLQAPARALRCHPAGKTGRILHPQVVAADIARQSGRDRRTWRLRTVPADAAPALDAAAQHLEARRADLTRQLSTLDALEDELIQAVAAGTLAATVTTPTKEN